MSSAQIFVFFGTIAILCSGAPQRSVIGSRNLFGHQNRLMAAPTRGPVTPAPVLSEALKSGPSSMSTSAPLTLDAIAVTSPSRNELDSVEISDEHRKDFEEYSYEVDGEPEEEQLRQKLCPGSPTGRQRLLFDRKAGKCAMVGDKAHCGDNMSFRYDTSDTNYTSVYGFCECDYGKSTVPLVYHEKSSACYFVYERAYCGPKEWLVFNGTGVAECVPKSCAVSRSRVLEVVVRLNGTGPCVRLDAHSEHCPSGEDTVHFRPYELFPKCGPPTLLPAPRLLSPIHSQSCSPGSYMSFARRCASVWTW